MTWLICSNKQGEPYTFEASSIKSSVRAALSDLLAAKQASDKEKAVLELQNQNQTQLYPGLYLILHQEKNEFPALVGFWIVFGPQYLEDGPKGAPDRDPPFAQEILEALTEEVWWKNYKVYPKDPKEKNTWHPLIVLNWPSFLAFRCEKPPPGLPLPEKELASNNDQDTSPESWLEQYDTTGVFLEKGQSKTDQHEIDYSDLPIKRSLIMMIKGKMSYSRVSHKGEYHLILHPNPQKQTDAGSSEVNSPEHSSKVRAIPFEDWFNKAVHEHKYVASKEENHFLGQPLTLFHKDSAAGVAFPISGWLTKDLSIWPMSPKDVRHSVLMPRDVGSRVWAQLKQAVGISLMVLIGIVTLTIIVYEATKPKIEEIDPPIEPAPQPALSLCSPDYEKFMNELRCQIWNFSNDVYSDNPVCGDRGAMASSLSSKESVALDKKNLQALYCGLRDRQDDGWMYKKGDLILEDFGTIALTKSCYNVLGYPYEYAVKLARNGEPEKYEEVPVPKRFFTGNLSVQQLINIRDDLDFICDDIKKRSESHIEGAIFSTLIGSSQPAKTEAILDKDIQRKEAYDLRVALADKAKGELGGKVEKSCFMQGMSTQPYVVEDFNLLCLPEDSKVSKERYPKKKFPIWSKLDGDNCTKEDSSNHPGRNLDSCSLIAQYETARFGPYPENPRKPLPRSTEDGEEATKSNSEPTLASPKSKPSALWRCHNNLGYKDAVGLRRIPVRWDLKLPVPLNYNVFGSGVKNQLRLDAGLLEIEVNPEVKESLGSCWSTVAKRLKGYTPVHPLLAELSPDSFVSDEQQLCGQLCALYYKFQMPKGNKGKDWITQRQDLRLCIHDKSPTSDNAQSGKGRFDSLLLPWNNKSAVRQYDWIEAKDEHVCAFNLIAQGFFPEGYLVGELAPAVWAGTTDENSRIAGGKKGKAYTSASTLNERYGQTRSRATCAYAAAQCFAGLMVETMHEADTSSEWKELFRNKVIFLSRLTTEELDFRELSLVQGSPFRENDIRSPWCRLIHEQLNWEDLSEGQLDLTCEMGVKDSYDKATVAIGTLVQARGAN